MFCRIFQSRHSDYFAIVPPERSDLLNSSTYPALSNPQGTLMFLFITTSCNIWYTSLDLGARIYATGVLERQVTVGPRKLLGLINLSVVVFIRVVLSLAFRWKRFFDHCRSSFGVEDAGCSSKTNWSGWFYGLYLWLDRYLIRLTSDLRQINFPQLTNCTVFLDL